MNVLHISFEFYPLAKTGGLADVVGALPKYLNEIECNTAVILPKYNTENSNKLATKKIFDKELVLGDNEYAFSIEIVTETHFDFPLYLVDIPELLYRDQMYGYQDDVARFISFQLAVLNWMVQMPSPPSIVHCHDHHTGLIPFLLKYCYDFDVLKNIPALVTIHNAQYQGQFGYEYEDFIPDFDQRLAGLLDWDGQINPLAAAIKCANKVTTVSPNYMMELQQKAAGLENLLSHEKKKCIGILNGIDATYWNPATDTFLIENYNLRNFISKRKVHKTWLCEQYGFKQNLPLFIFIGRLVYEKGADLLPEVITNLLPQMPINILLLGSGDPVIAQQLKDVKQAIGNKYNMHIGYDEKLAHIMYAGGDFILMPSRVEPCGLNQMYALRYGTIPVVRRTGGLQDTVVDIGDDGYGICHVQASVQDICDAIQRAVALYDNHKQYRLTQRRAMKIDNSWNNSALKYKKLYQSLIT